MNRLRISFSEKQLIKGSIKIEGETSFIMSCMASVIEKLADAYNVPEQRVLQDIWAVIQKEKAQKV